MMSGIINQIQERQEQLNQNQSKLGGLFVMDYLGNKKILHLVAFDFNENAKKIVLEVKCDDITFSEALDFLEEELSYRKIHLISRELFEKNLTRYKTF